MGKSLVEVIGDYLRQLWNCALGYIRRELQSSMDGMPFRIVMTVPAHWPTYAQDQIQRAVQQAGLLDSRGLGLETKFEFVGEAEAAVLAAFFDSNVRCNINVSIECLMLN